MLLSLVVRHPAIKGCILVNSMTLLRKDTFIKLPDNRQLAYAEYGDEQGMPVFLFHGLPGTRLSWGWLPGNPFPEDLRIIAPDRPGYGQSDAKPGRTLLDLSDDIRALADALGIRNFAVVGVSGGGPGALACAWKMPDRIHALSIVASAAPTNVPGVFAGMSKTNRFFMKLAWYAPWLSSINIRLLGMVIRRNPERYINSMKFKVHAADQTLLKRADIKEMLVKDFAEALGNGSQGMIDDMSANHGHPWRIPLDQIKARVHFWYCEYDHSVPVSMGNYLNSMLPNSELTVVPGAGHLWVLVHLHEILDDIKQTIQENQQKGT
ncbi:MAG: alpha/beta hydrolase [Gammaproteobacteria bacterium]